MRVLGVDPGLRLTGYACLDDAPDRPTIVEAGVLRLKGLHAPDGSPASDAGSIIARLDELDRDFRAVLARLRPDTVAVESLFAHYRHPATAIVMGHARGVLLLAARQASLPVMEFKPKLVKKSMTGHGGADKGRMQLAVQSYFELPEPPSPPDVADAIAIAMCGLRRSVMGPVVVEQL